MWFRRNGRHFAATVKEWFYSLKKNNQIAILVALAHVLAILWMSIDYFLSDRPKIRHSVIVRTIRQQNAPIHISASPPATKISTPAKASALIQQTAPQKTEAVASRPTRTNSSKIKKLAAATSIRSSKKNVNDRAPAPTFSAETLQEISHELNAIASPSSSSLSQAVEIKLPPILQSKTALNASIEERISQESVPSGYHLSLIDLLQSSLQLPEIGEVRVKIVLSSPGTLSSIHILDAKSEKNANWLKNQLPLLSLPCFNDFGIVDATLEFTVTFRNVENN